MKIIHLRDALTEMNEGKPFSISFITCDQERKTGGDLMKLEDVILSFNQNHIEKFGFDEPESNVTDIRKAPRHYEHATRNVLLKNGMRRKFHIRLLLEFNGQKVFY